ncbi:MAG: formate/nitrite transporter family protein [Bacteroides sp.]|nr:formate/nitrite transporter family protein [Bacteroides sp.]
MALRTPQEILELSVSAATRKSSLGRRPLLLLTLAMMAGAFIALGGALSIIAGWGFTDVSTTPSLQKLLSGLTFPIGLVLTVILGAELFTGNNAMMMPAYLQGKVSGKDVIINWVAVWSGNFLGALLFAFLLVKLTGTLDASPYRESLITMAQTKASLPWLTTLMRGIGANWLVCLAVWLAMSADSLGGKGTGCWIPVAAFVMLGYEHCVANMFFLPCAIMLGADIAASDLWLNLLWATAGNIIGGALFVGCLHAYVHRPLDS